MRPRPVAQGNDGAWLLQETRTLANRRSVSVGDNKGGGDTIGQRSAFVARRERHLARLGVYLCRPILLLPRHVI